MSQVEATEEARTFSATERKKAKAAGQTIPGTTSFPIKTKADLKNAIQAYGRAKNKAAAKAHIIRRAKALGATDMLPEGWMSEKSSTDTAHEGLISCPEEGCSRHFNDEAALLDHAEAVHTFDDIRRAVHGAIREKFGREPNYQSSPKVPGIYTWVEDLATDWVVFQYEESGDSKLLKVSYVINNNGVVTLGEPIEVTRRTVYDPVGTNSREGAQG